MHYSFPTKKTLWVVNATPYTPQGTPGPLDRQPYTQAAALGPKRPNFEPKRGLCSAVVPSLFKVVP